MKNSYLDLFAGEGHILPTIHCFTLQNQGLFWNATFNEGLKNDLGFRMKTSLGHPPDMMRFLNSPDHKDSESRSRTQLLRAEFQILEHMLSETEKYKAQRTR
jgi:hypothetical protein